MHLDRRLRSDKPDVHYFITSPLPPRDLGVEFAQPTALTVTPNSTFGAVGGQEQIIESPHRVKEEEEEEILEEESEEEEDEVFDKYSGGVTFIIPARQRNILKSKIG